jgi:transcriptional antiterminator Rof (Rho-off)
MNGPIIIGGNCGVCYTLIYSEKGDYLTIACLKRYFDYLEIKFYKEYNEKIEFNSEKEAIDYLNLNFEREDIDPKFYKVRKKI